MGSGLNVVLTFRIGFGFGLEIGVVHILSTINHLLHRRP